MRLGCGEPSLVIGNSWLITWQLLPLLRQSWKKKLFSYRHLRHGEDNKEVLLGHGEKRAWQLWSEKVKQFKKRRQQGAAPSFMSEMEGWGRSSTESNEMKAASKSSTCNRERRWLDYTLSRENN